MVEGLSSIIRKFVMKVESSDSEELDGVHNDIPTKPTNKKMPLVEYVFPPTSYIDSDFTSIDDALAAFRRLHSDMPRYQRSMRAIRRG